MSILPATVEQGGSIATVWSDFPQGTTSVVVALGDRIVYEPQLSQWGLTNGVGYYNLPLDIPLGSLRISITPLPLRTTFTATVTVVAPR